MSSRFYLFSSFLILTASTCCAQQGGAPTAKQTTTSPPPLIIQLPGFADGSKVPIKYTCSADSAMVSPEIRWSQVPAGTQSFALVFHDLEPHPAKGIMDNTHWVLWNIPATSPGLPEGVPAGSVLPDGTHQLKRPRTVPAGSPFSYYGPCAPPGPDHHYVWELYALDIKLDLPDDAARIDVLKAMDGHILGASTWVGYFHR
jgi:Raf kinase inhibitor-like YbhB/YbcL family protein